jgi:hypothetical protein
MPVSLETLRIDLADETSDLERLINGLTAEGWDTATPAAGWSIP